MFVATATTFGTQMNQFPSAKPYTAQSAAPITMIARNDWETSSEPRPRQIVRAWSSGADAVCVTPPVLT
jgi:hypothetical protein